MSMKIKLYAVITRIALLTVLVLLTIMFLPNSFAQGTSADYTVRLVYLLPSDRETQPNIDAKIDTLIKDAQEHLADEMERHGYGRKTFTFETDGNGKAVVHHITSPHDDEYFHNRISDDESLSNYFGDDFDLDKYIFLALLDVSTEILGADWANWCGFWGGMAWMPASGPCFSRRVALHEIGHGFGLTHNFHSDTYLMSYGGGEQLSACAAEWLDVNRYLNRDKVITPNYDTRIYLLSNTPDDTPPYAQRLRFEIKDPDGMHQAQFITSGQNFSEYVECKSLRGMRDIVEFTTTENLDTALLLVMDKNGNYRLANVYFFEIISIPDANLAAVIRAQFEYPSDERIIKEDMDRLSELSANNQSIRDLTGLEHATSLEKLYLGQNNISDISALADLILLNELYLEDNSISDLLSLVENTGLGDGDKVDVSGNPLNAVSIHTYIPTLQTRGVEVIFEKLVDPIGFRPSTVADQTFQVGTPVNITLPEATDGTPPYTYSLSPIPVGLQFDAATQILSGTPTTATPATLTTYTATDTTEASTSLTFTITVTGATPADITFIPNAIDDLMLSINTPMQPVYLPLAEGGTPPYTYTLDPIPTGLSFNAATKLLSGTPTIAETTPTTYTATDAASVSASLTFTIEVTEGVILDVNGDGQVTVIDLAIVAFFYGTQLPVGTSFPADVNSDGTVDLSDLTAVAEAIDAAGTGGTLSADDLEVVLEAVAAQANVIEGGPEAPARLSTSQHARFSSVAARNVAAAFQAVKHHTTDEVRLRKWMPLLKELLERLSEITEIPEMTTLLPNYPNPFNPETWIPYHLVQATDVTLTIHDIHGRVVRVLDFGHQQAGIYQSRARAAYWNGKNQLGEKVVSGVYFYTLTAGEFNATRKLLIIK